MKISFRRRIIAVLIFLWIVVTIAVHVGQAPLYCWLSLVTGFCVLVFISTNTYVVSKEEFDETNNYVTPSEEVTVTNTENTALKHNLFLLIFLVIFGIVAVIDLTFMIFRCSYYLCREYHLGSNSLVLIFEAILCGAVLIHIALSLGQIFRKKSFILRDKENWFTLGRKQK